MTNKISEKDCIQDLETVLQEELFTRLVGETATESYNNVQAGTLQNTISERIYYLNKVVGCLRGAYNEEGIKNWFYRERAQLERNSPLQYLSHAWNPEDENAQKVLELAKSLNH